MLVPPHVCCYARNNVIFVIGASYRSPILYPTPPTLFYLSQPEFFAPALVLALY